VFYDGFARLVRDAERAGCNNATAVIASRPSSAIAVQQR
jgi:hypothetical protein